MPPRYVHTNLIARDWRRLADFYGAAFDGETAAAALEHGGQPVGPRTEVEVDGVVHLCF